MGKPAHDDDEKVGNKTETGPAQDGERGKEDRGRKTRHLVEVTDGEICLPVGAEEIDVFIERNRPRGLHPPISPCLLLSVSL